MEKTDNSQQPTKSAVAAVAAGILVIIAGFIMYNYFAKTGGEITEESEKIEVLEEDKNQEELTKPEETVKSPTMTKPTDIGSVTVSGQSGEQAPAWSANQYQPGDIKGSRYTVVRGDTLWQIAQARYGDPLMWTKILDANSGQIGILANGNPLITPGQVLILPD